LPDRKTQLIIRQSIFDANNITDLNSLDASNTRITGSSVIDIGAAVKLHNVTSEGGLNAGVDTSSAHEIKNSTFEGNVTLDGSLDCEQLSVRGTFSVTGTITGNTKFAGQAVGGTKILTFSATPTFNCNEGNVFYMPVTADVTEWNISNEKPGGSYRIYMVLDGNPHTIGNPGASVDKKTDNSADFAVAANNRNIIDISVDPNGYVEYSIETST
jgi:hypothetical protein